MRQVTFKESDDSSGKDCKSSRSAEQQELLGEIRDLLKRSSRDSAPGWRRSTATSPPDQGHHRHSTAMCANSWVTLPGTARRSRSATVVASQDILQRHVQRKGTTGHHQGAQRVPTGISRPLAVMDRPHKPQKRAGWTLGPGYHPGCQGFRPG